MENIIEEKVKTTKTNYFWYENSSKHACTHVYKRRKEERYMCHRKIRTNIGDNQPDYKCSQHSKLHIPKKRTKKTNKEKNNIKKRKKRKQKKIYICNNGNINLGSIIEKILNQ